MNEKACKAALTDQQSFAGEVPSERSDHSCNIWRYCDDGTWKDLMVLFGGSTNEGLSDEIWLFDFKLQR